MGFDNAMFGAVLSQIKLMFGYISNPNNLAILGILILLAEAAINHLIINLVNCEFEV